MVETKEWILESALLFFSYSHNKVFPQSAIQILSPRSSLFLSIPHFLSNSYSNRHSFLNSKCSEDKIKDDAEVIPDIWGSDAPSWLLNDRMLGFL